MTAEPDKLQAVLNDLRTRMAKLESGGSASQLSYSAVETTEGRGYIPVMENGVEKHRIGRQPDGTITAVSVNNTDPPAIPNDPLCAPFLGGVTVQCTGFKSTQYLDFSHINIYVDGGVVGTMSKVPDAFAVSPLDQNPHSFQLTSVNLSGTESPKTNAIVATPNLVVGADIADGIIDTLKLADDAVTQAKVALAAITNTEIAANTILGGNIAAGTISGTNIAGQTITGDNILANAITALQLAANSVTATQIKAGSVDATKLSAQIIIAAVSFIVGNPVAQRLVLDKLGLSQFDAQGNLALQFGATPTSGGGNFLTIIDPKDSTNALASIGQDGSMTMSGISINGAATINGVDLVSFLNNTPNGVVAFGQSTASPATTSEVGWYELQFTQYSNRMYRVMTTQMFAQGGGGVCSVRYTDDGSVPTLSSTLLANCVCSDNSYILTTTNSNNTRTVNDTTPTGYTGVGTGGGTNGLTAGGGADGHAHNYGTNHTHDAGSHFHGMNHSHDMQHTHVNREAFRNSGISFILGRNDGDRRVRLLFTAASLYGQNVQVYSQGGLGTQFWIEDIGAIPTTTGGSNAGGGGSSATGQFVAQWSAISSAWFSSGENFAQAHVGDMRQGFDGTNYYTSQFAFDVNSIQTVIAPATTIQKVEIYLYSYYWTQASGGTCSIGAYTDSSGPPPATYTYNSRNLVDQKMGKPQGMWIQLPVSVGNSMKTQSIKGFVLDSRARSDENTQVNFSRFRDNTYTDASVRPQLRITFIR